MRHVLKKRASASSSGASSRYSHRSSTADSAGVTPKYRGALHPGFPIDKDESYVRAHEIYRSGAAQKGAPPVKGPKGDSCQTADLHFSVPGARPKTPSTVSTSSSAGGASVRSQDVYKAYRERMRHAEYEGYKAARPQGSYIMQDQTCTSVPRTSRAILQKAEGLRPPAWRWQERESPAISPEECQSFAATLGLAPDLAEQLFEALVDDYGLSGHEGEVTSQSDLEWFVGHFGPAIDATYLCHRPQIIGALRRCLGNEGSSDCVPRQRPSTASSRSSRPISANPRLHAAAETLRDVPPAGQSILATLTGSRKKMGNQTTDYLEEMAWKASRRPSSARPGSSSSSSTWHPGRATSIGSGSESFRPASAASSGSSFLESRWRAAALTMQEALPGGLEEGMSRSSLVPSSAGDVSIASSRSFDGLKAARAAADIAAAVKPYKAPSVASTAASEEEFGVIKTVPGWRFEFLHGRPATEDWSSVSGASSRSNKTGKSNNSMQMAICLGAIPVDETEKDEVEPDDSASMIGGLVPMPKPPATPRATRRPRSRASVESHEAKRHMLRQALEFSPNFLAGAKATAGRYATFAKEASTPRSERPMSNRSRKGHSTPRPKTR